MELKMVARASAIRCQFPILMLTLLLPVVSTSAIASAGPVPSTSSPLPRFRAVTTGASDSLVRVGGEAARAVLEKDEYLTCSLTLITDDSPAAPATPLLQTLRTASQGPSLVMVVDEVEGNLTLSFARLLPLARQVRQRSWCTRVVVASRDAAFLATFARGSLGSRLLVWAARLVVLTSLPPPQLQALLPASWTFAWMNTLVVNVADADPGEPRCDVYSFLPFSPAGTGVVRVASWTPARGLLFLSHLPLFPDKYSSFHGAEINVTARAYLPFWGESEQESASDQPSDTPARKQLYGPDFHQLEAMAQALNFTYRIVPAASWEEVEDLVSSRACLLVGVGFIVLSTRLQRHDYTVIFLLDANTFVMARPSLSSDWMAVFRPLPPNMWGGVVGSLLLVTLVLWTLLGKRAKQIISRSGRGRGGRQRGIIKPQVGGAGGEVLDDGRRGVRGEEGGWPRGRGGRGNGGRVRENELPGGIVLGAGGREALGSEKRRIEENEEQESIGENRRGNTWKGVGEEAGGIEELEWKRRQVEDSGEKAWIGGDGGEKITNAGKVQQTESSPAGGIGRGTRGRGERSDEEVTFWATLQALTGVLVGQNLPQRLSGASASRLVVATWLIFAYVIISVYNGNLTATLTVPTYPPRPETLAELVKATDRLTMKSYLTGLCEVLLKSSSPIQNAVAQKMEVVSSTEEALSDVLTKKEAYVDNNSYLRYTIAESFTHADGSTNLYLVRERVFPSYLGLLVPHDAPYTANLNRWLQAIVESGLYMKWTDDVVRQTRVKSQQRRREDAAKQGDGGAAAGGGESGEAGAEGEGGAAGTTQTADSERGAVALNPTHLQGAFAVLCCGISLALLTFALEVTTGRRNRLHVQSSLIG